MVKHNAPLFLISYETDRNLSEASLLVEVKYFILIITMRRSYMTHTVNHSEAFVQSATGKLEKVLLSRPDYLALAAINEIASEWMDRGIRIDIKKALEEHDALIELYRRNGVEVVIQKPKEKLTSMVFARDFGFNLKEGCVLGRFKEELRKEESDLFAAKMEELGVPVIARCTEGVVEGGDFWQLDETTLVIGRLQRSTKEGIENIRQQLTPYGYRIIEVESDPRYLHLDMIFNIVGEKTAVAYWDGLPVHFQKYLTDEGYDIITIEESGVFKHFSNLQALGNKKVISLKANTEVNRQLRERGYEVFELDSTEILMTGGGPHCMTFPLKRD